MEILDEAKIQVFATGDFTKVYTREGKCFWFRSRYPEIEFADFPQFLELGWSRKQRRIHNPNANVRLIAFIYSAKKIDRCLFVIYVYKKK